MFYQLLVRATSRVSDEDMRAFPRKTTRVYACRKGEASASDSALFPLEKQRPW